LDEPTATEPELIDLEDRPGSPDSEPTKFAFPPRSGIILRKELELVYRYADSQDSMIRRYRIPIPGTGVTLFSDAFRESDRLLIEAKSDAERGSVRMALAQLLDYERFLAQPLQLSVLVPIRPVDDLVDLLSSHGIGIIYEDGPESGRFRTESL
jgi:5-methylcytosine-specific restriction protein A